MDLSLIKSKLTSFQSKGQTKDKVDYTKIFWKPKVGEYQVRIVPSKFNKSTPFREVNFHYGIAKFPILALTNWGEADPIVEASLKLRKSTDPEHWQMAKKISPKMRIFAPVIIRGEEGAGVRLWEFGKEIYQQLLSIAMNEDYGDYTDIADGRDFTVTAVEAEVAGRKGIKCTLLPRGKTSALSNDAELVNKWLDEQPDVLAINKRHTYESLNEIFQKWANPDSEESEETPVAESKPEAVTELPWSTEEEAPSHYSLQQPAVKTSKAEKFEDLFND
jgi:hypothetical protein